MTRSTRAILEELEATVVAAENILQASPNEEPGVLDALRERIAAAKAKLIEYYSTAREKVIAGARYTDDTVRENPYRSLAVAAGVGVVIGILISRRKSHDHE